MIVVKYIVCVILLISSLFFVAPTNAQIIMDCSSVDTNRTNLGLYGGYIIGLAHSVNNKRLFAATESPYGLFQSDDTGNTWMTSYPLDSLFYDCGNRGWGGYSRKLMSNTHNWVAASNQTSCMISFKGGDNGSWHTAIDKYYMDSVLNKPATNIEDFSITDHYIYVSFGTNVLINDTIPFATSDVYTIGSQILVNGNNNPRCDNISAANSSSGFPVYLGIYYNSQEEDAELYSFNGSLSTKINLPITHCSVNKIMVHPASSTGDTLFIQITDSTDNDRQKLYLSKNGGSTWVDVTTPIINNGHYPMQFSIDYSPNWLTITPLGNGAVLYADNQYYSKDLGSTWISLAGDFPYTILPDTIEAYLSSSAYGVVFGINVTSTNLSLQKNKNLSAIQIKKIARSKGKHVFYLATESGLAYTSAYVDSNVAYVDKWKAPYGDFPITINGSLDNSVTCVAVDLNDSLHVITGNRHGLCVSTTGPNGFQAAAYPGAWSEKDVYDIEFINSNIIIAITGSENNNSGGEIWRSTDAGANWSIVVPFGFDGGNALAVGKNATDTIAYAISGRIPSNDTSYIWQSTDLGQNWTAINTAPSYTSSFGKNQMVDIDVVPGTTDSLYILTYGLDVGIGTAASLLSTSGGGGISFTNIQSINGRGYALMIDQSGNDSVYIAIDNKLKMYEQDSNDISDEYIGLNGDNIYDIEHGSILVGSTTGFYSVELAGFDDLILGTNNNSSIFDNNLFAIYPNPADNNLFIEPLSNKQTDMNIELYDLLGNKINALNKPNIRMHEIIETDVSDLSSGIYVLKIKCDKKTDTFKLMIK